MTDLYLIVHKVRGEAAFDVASRMECPICHGQCEHTPEWPCVECDSTGYWWIIPTSGHRAYPYGSWALESMHYKTPRSPVLLQFDVKLMSDIMPEDCVDHYPHRAEANRAEAKRPALDISALIPKKPSAPIRRRA